MSNFNRITVNGKDYESIDDIPKELRVMFKDANNNGIPDFVEGILAGANDMKSAAVHTSGNKDINANFTTFLYKGKQFNDLEQLPPEAKVIVEKGLNSIENSGMKIATGFTGQQEIQNPANQTNMDAMKNDAIQELNPGFKFRLIMTIILFIMAVVYIIWLSKLI